jgi:hypothetical protein
MNHFELTGVDNLELTDAHRGVFSGTIKILPSLPRQSADVVIKSRTTAKALQLKVNDGVYRDLSVPTPPKRADGGLQSLVRRKRSHCMPADVTLHFRDGFSLNNLRISTTGGRIQVYSDLHVANATSITTKTGRIQSHQFFNTRKTYINSGSSSLQGHFKLYDLLSIISTSGSIDVTIEPQEADKEHPKPAELIISSQSGRVQLNSVPSPPLREYITSVSSKDGMIQGSLIHGSKTIVGSHSGRIQLGLLPYIFKGFSSSTLNVHSQSGSQRISVHSPVGGYLDGMTSIHTSQSGSMELNYPQDWRGQISGQTSSGSIEVKGDGVHIIEQGPRYVRAEKDNGDSKLKFSGASGSVQVNFGL